MEELKYYYGLIGDSYGFVDSDDERSKLEGLVELTKEEHQQLLDEQSQGKEIVFYDGEVFTAPYGLYYLDENKIWHKKDETEYEQEQLTKAKQVKYQENNTKSDNARYNNEFSITLQGKECIFDTSQKTQADLLTAFAVCSTGTTYDGWITNNSIELNLTLEDVVLISIKFKQLSSVYQKWKYYKELIDNAQTINEVNAITIIY